MKVSACFSALLALASFAFGENNVPPAGFTALFNGKDMEGWRGGDTADHRAYAKLPDAEKTKWTEDMRKHWKVEDGELLNDGNGKYATTEKEYGNFEPFRTERTRAAAGFGTTAPVLREKIRWCSRTSLRANGIISAS